MRYIASVRPNADRRRPPWPRARAAPRPRATTAARLALVIAISAAACKKPVAENASGAEVYASACANCHGADGRPPAAMIAQLGVRDLTTPNFVARANQTAIEQQIRHGSENKLMPAFAGALSDAQVRAVAQYVLSLGQAGAAPPPAPTSTTPPPSSGAPAAGGG